jgi:hypothetical protein
LTKENIMLLKSRLCEPDTMIRTGLTCLVVGLFAQRFIHPPGDFWQGFVAGISGLLVGLSIALNIRGLVLQRERKNCDGR